MDCTADEWHSFLHDTVWARPMADGCIHHYIATLRRASAFLRAHITPNEELQGMVDACTLYPRFINICRCRTPPLILVSDTRVLSPGHRPAIWCWCWHQHHQGIRTAAR